MKTLSFRKFKMRWSLSLACSEIKPDKNGSKSKTGNTKKKAIPVELLREPSKSSPQ